MPATLVTLVTFNGLDDGGQPKGSLIADASGDLFGATPRGGGSSGSGTVFEIKKTATGYASAPTTLVAFNGLNGQDSVAGLLADANGDLFGTTETGGSGPTASGTVFEIAETATGYATTPTVLASFSGADGSTPEAARSPIPAAICSAPPRRAATP
jgi:hypothetical protein